VEILCRFAGDQSGATAIEYALIASCIFLVIVGAVSAIGTSLNSIFSQVSAGFGSN
jgi:pilus assembly protein Flp/PilA